MLLLLLSMPLVKSRSLCDLCDTTMPHGVNSFFFFCGTSSSGLQISLKNALGTVLLFWLAFQGLFCAVCSY